MALAGLGGHLRSNGSPGWTVLGRAFDNSSSSSRGGWQAPEIRSMISRSVRDSFGA
jgi:hypothetical protein